MDLRMNLFDGLQFFERFSQCFAGFLGALHFFQIFDGVHLLDAGIGSGQGLTCHRMAVLQGISHAYSER